MAPLNVRALVISYPDDEHAAAVLASLEERKISTVLLDLEQLERSDFLLEPTALRLGLESDVTLGAASERGWIRRFARDDWRSDASPIEHAGVVRAAWISAFTAIVSGLGVEWLTDLDKLYLAENKAYQLLVAAKVGTPIPRTVCTNRRDMIPIDLGDEFVVKPLGPGAFRDEAGTMQVVHANRVRRTDDALDSIGAAPFLIQQLLRARSHLRVVTVRDAVWVCELDAAGYSLDWRRDDAAHDSFVPASGYDDVRRYALDLARVLGVGYSSQDWIVTDSGRFFIDLNPSGQWLFLPDPVCGEVTERIAAWLTGADT